LLSQVMRLLELVIYVLDRFVATQKWSSYLSS
jgi:hypothetical protein